MSPFHQASFQLLFCCITSIYCGPHHHRGTCQYKNVADDSFSYIPFTRQNNPLFPFLLLYFQVFLVFWNDILNAHRLYDLCGLETAHHVIKKPTLCWHLTSIFDFHKKRFAELSVEIITFLHHNHAFYFLLSRKVFVTGCITVAVASIYTLW